MASFIQYSPEIKKLFFNQPRVKRFLDEIALKAGFWFGGRVREKTRQYIGKPNLAGTVRVTASGKSRKVSRRKPRPPGKPPIARTNDNVLTLRNVQYFANRGGGDVYSSTTVFVPKFKSGRNASKSVPEMQEFGGQVRVRAKYVQDRTKRGRPRVQGGKPLKSLVFSKLFPFKTFNVPPRPYLGPTFEKVATGELKKRIARGQFNERD